MLRISPLVRSLDTELALRFPGMEMLEFDPCAHVLDLGCGLGGPARLVAERQGCYIEAVDNDRNVIEAAEYLSGRWNGPHWKVQFSVADALALPFPDEIFDIIWMQHVAMSIADRRLLYQEIVRVLRPGGDLLTHDILQGTRDVIYPTPWARSRAESTILSAEQTRMAMEGAGLRVRLFARSTHAALQKGCIHTHEIACVRASYLQQHSCCRSLVR